jgi:hypothetical protein
MNIKKRIQAVRNSPAYIHLQATRVELNRVKAVAASAYQVLNLALQEPKDSAMTAHLVHVATVALGTIED